MDASGQTLSTSLGKTTRSRSITSETSAISIQPTSASAILAGSASDDKKRTKGGPKNPSSSQQQQQPSSTALPTTAANSASNAAIGAKAKAASLSQSLSTNRRQVDFFAHLPQYNDLLSGIGKHSIHPSILKLGLLYANYQITGESARCRHLLLAFKDVIRDYQIIPDQAISRHLEIHLRPLIAFLVQARPLSVSMGHAIRGLKLKISTLPPETVESEAKSILYDYIDYYLQNRLVMADKLIVQHGLRKIYNGDVILTFGKSEVIRDLLIAAHHKGISFRVIIVGARPLDEGSSLVSDLISAGINRCLYIQMNAVGYIMREVTKTIIGAHCFFSNGSMLARVGTAMLCHLSQRANVPVIACCQSVKFTERVQLDSFVHNEIGDPEALVKQSLHTNSKKYPLASWRSIESLRLLNILYDLTPPELVSMVITEVGIVPVTSIPVVLREYNQSILTY